MCLYMHACRYMHVLTACSEATYSHICDHNGIGV